MITPMLSFAFILLAPLVTTDDNASPTHWWSDEVAASLDRAPEHKASWEAMLTEAPPEHRPGLSYLIAYLPDRDLQSLSPADLATNVQLAYQARASVSWGEQLPDELFLDAVLPHASVTEPRDSMRAEFLERYLPIVQDCATPGEAALRVNENLFKDYSVRYNTRRLRTDQNSKESIAQGMATCTGLSIMLVEACRAVGVPARVVGIRSWPGRGGNHTWVEVWDAGDWHFVGAAEPDPNGLDHAWFVGRAAGAIKESPPHAIFAATYKPTGTTFPLAWNRRAQIPAENVTDRYTRSNNPTPTGPRLLIDVRQGGDRVEADVIVFNTTTGAVILEAQSPGSEVDLNRYLEAEVPSGTSVLITAHYQGNGAFHFTKTGDDNTNVQLGLDSSQKVSVDDLQELSGLLQDRFGDDSERQELASRLLTAIPFRNEFRELAWDAYRASPVHEKLREDFEANIVKTDDREAPYLWRKVGEEPEEGWPLVIAMHGGGGVPKAFNDRAWRQMFERYYKDHPEAGGYIYLALRAPNDRWNGFYDDAICPMVQRLILQFVLFGGVDPSRVYALGASHGGYGAFVIGPKMPDRFAAVHASAAAPTPGETIGENLRNLPFTFMIGARDTAYGRADRCQEFAQLLEEWQAEYGGYPGGIAFLEGVGHSVPDRDKVPELLATGPRNAYPDRLIWIQSDNVLTDHYWLEVPDPTEGARVEAKVEGNTITLHADDINEIILWPNSPLINLAEPIIISIINGQEFTLEPRPNLGTYCQSLFQRADRDLAAPVRLVVPLAADPVDGDERGSTSGPRAD